MPKMKSNKSVAARFKVTGSGLLKRNRPGKRHKLSKKSSQAKRNLSKHPIVDRGQVGMYKRMMLV
ncbi:MULTISPECIES: 50S ribosomal protein L35 [Chlamydia]|uniref:Large ribosomal subunit protein bL35 n=2 Tax=Chlamydia pecorum TaxID=85991 RepID=A0AA34RC92_CHLPE|nr:MULTISPECIES: 50S ribosomal protein L35 [Chlamydia]AEB41077.1 ribosomal protein L35 [Chlamydia pecorum E58]AGW38218.1 50S ribosomal protein L35 [Chlamydia pecorum PV3056/3]AGW39142.1 50S ribosomal protein L35 [Chlamydia pecorum W73]AGW40068.1 50S ribosomal protein L35 [Chlamydia pecorum P787]ETF38431.1 50S ribosomal protein L35 [Chlamydia pecorum VR629]